VYTKAPCRPRATKTKTGQAERNNPRFGTYKAQRLLMSSLVTSLFLLIHCASLFLPISSCTPACVPHAPYSPSFLARSLTPSLPYFHRRCKSSLKPAVPRHQPFTSSIASFIVLSNHSSPARKRAPSAKTPVAWYRRRELRWYQW